MRGTGLGRAGSNSYRKKGRGLLVVGEGLHLRRAWLRDLDLTPPLRGLEVLS